MSCRKITGKVDKNGSQSGLQDFATLAGVGGPPPPCPPGGADKWNLNYCTLSGWSWTKKDPSPPTGAGHHQEIRVEPRRSRKSNLREVLMCCIPGADGEISTAPNSAYERRSKTAVSSPSSCDNIRCPYRKRFIENEHTHKGTMKKCKSHHPPVEKKKTKTGKSKKNKNEPLPSPQPIACTCQPVPPVPPVIYYPCHCHCCDQHNKEPQAKRLENKMTNTTAPDLETTITPSRPSRTAAQRTNHSISRERCDCKLLQSMAEAILNESGREKAYDIYNLETPYSPLTRNFHHYTKINRPSRLFIPKPFGYNSAAHKRSTPAAAAGVTTKLTQPTPSFSAEDTSDMDKQLHNLLRSIKVDSTQFLDNPSMRLDDPFL